MSYELAPLEPDPDPPLRRSPAETARTPPHPSKQRLLSLDVYRGLIMISLAFAGFGLANTAKNMLAVQPDSELWKGVRIQFSHVDWVGWGYWDLIQPSFMFMVGVSMAYSYAKRRQLGHSYPRMFGHALFRSIVLILLGVFLTSNWSRSTYWSLMNVLTQIGLGYTFLFLLWCGRNWIFYCVAAMVLLVGTWAAYFFFPHAGIDLTSASEQAGVTSEWAGEHLADVPSAWHKNANVGSWVDGYLLNQFPRTEPLKPSSGGYQTINFIPSLATMLFGLMCGELLRRPIAPWWKLLILCGAGAGGILIGLALDYFGVCPIIKRIWTPSWAIFSGGICVLILASLYAVIDVLRLRSWTFPFVVVGMNSIAIYCMAQLLKPWVRDTWETHLGPRIFTLRAQFGTTTYAMADLHYLGVIRLCEPTIQAVAVGLTFWLVCLWMYRQKIFIRI